MTIVLAGASGLVGAQVAQALGARSFAVIARRHNPALGQDVTQFVGAPEDWPALVAQAQPSVLISTLGTTIRVAGSQAGFAAVDHDLLLALAAATRAAGARQCLAVSSVGADRHSRNFYLRTKGEAEAGLAALGFERLDLLRPGLLLGARTGARRPGEAIAMALAPLTNALTPARFDRYRAIHASDVAHALVSRIGARDGGVHIHENRAMLAMRD